ncbi:4-hydroxy-tetrahydrodipicolinate reductase [Methanocorpusculum sp.]|nr:4-hydroxy-tetrahydrodipicolinate reductase [Methanocorpusculum sp.]MBO5368330.1 4-hydroxy-tetrahydrodipicolinate reductase [Methanocorpusculum sp.]MBO5430550.1 4-hydroxy-tetrahydrodipicolinate reductase [Methanocorpusculum sp.]MBQ3570880.1 4-hydroxy-tetrahydrodipicolinate reductase [Methanocorpusculum sp.]MBQ4597814.1 4-hydroxy-tetrahydrodipicolinate reductase [Methanocorpusculum sp.]
MTKVIICGAFGRMGTTIAQMVLENPELEFAGGVDIREGELHGKPVVTSDKLADFIDSAKPDVMIDFTVAAATMVNAKIAAAKGVALVIGTTGFTPEQDAELLDAIKNVPVVKTTNFSVGVNIFWELVREAAKRLGDYDIEVIEAHHRHKKDAPSGTAKTILRVLEEETGKTEEMYGRCGMTERKGEIGVHVIRGGDVVGDHSVQFHQNYETIELSHRAYDRAVFARGAVRAAAWAPTAEPGLYTMKEVLGL